MTEASLALDLFLPYRLSFTSNLVSERIAQVYSDLFGLTIPQWRLIAVIAERRAVSQQQICAKTGMDKVTVSRAAVTLAARKLIARRPNPEDRRSHLLALTRDGESLFDAIAPRARQLETEIFACLDRTERKALLALLARIDAHVLGRPAAGG